MKIVDNIQEFLVGLDEQQFYRYLLGVIAGLVLLMAALIFYYYQHTGNIRSELTAINDLRETEIKVILERSKQLHQARKTVDETLAKSPNFKIKGYILEVIQKLNLSSMFNSAESLPSIDRDKDYRESLLKVTFTDMNMKQLTELLSELEKNERISTKELEITQSKKQSAINVVLTIGTLHPQTEMPE